MYLVPCGQVGQFQFMLTDSVFNSCSLPFFVLGGEVIVIAAFSVLVSTIAGGVPPGKVYFETSTLGEKERVNKELAVNFSFV